MTIEIGMKAVAMGIVVVFCLGLSARAQEVSPVDLVYATENFRPYNFEEHGKATGMAVDLLRLIWEEMDIPEQEIMFFPWARGYHMLQHEERVVLFTTARTEARESAFKWVCPIEEGNRSILIGLKSKQIKLQSLDDSKKYRIGTVRNDATDQMLREKGFSDQLVPVTNMSQNIHKLHIDRIDLIAYDEKSIYSQLSSGGHNPEEYETLHVINEIPLCYALNQNVPDDLVVRMQNALDHVRESSEYTALLEKYLE